ncbi:MAG: hypothetical protein LQ346_008170 [Caloplaca aetnensis]|nr:MAG: hypothetical protein LQ346_008170 [Caloplaca aetnensis]
MVNFFVGHKKKHYNIHRALLCSTSPVLKAHFGDVETKHPRNDMYLLQHDLQAFEIFVTFLYRRNFPDITPRTGTPNINGQLGTPADNDGANLDILLNLHLMSCDWLIPDLQNATLDHISRYVTKASIFFRHRQITTIYERIKNPRAPLRRFAVDHFVHSVMKRSVDAKTRQLCLTNRLQIDSSAFLYEVIEAIIGGKRYPMPIDPENKGRCAYHEHPNGVRCQEG